MDIVFKNIFVIDKIFYWVYARPLWQIVLFMIVAISIWAFCGKKFAKRRIWQSINIIIAIGMTLVIIYLTVVRREPSSNFGVYLLPSQNLDRAVANPGIWESIYLNAFLFFPLGLSIPFALPQKFKHKVLATIAICFVFSVCVEVIQGIFSLGDVEIFDILMNVFGSAIGCIAYFVSCKLKI